MSVKIKICGFTEPDSLRAAARLDVDWAGFNFFEKSPRYVTPSAAQNLLLGVGNMIPVALLVDPDNAMLDEIAALGFPILQLHGKETPQRVAEIKARTGLEIWKAVGIRTRVNLDEAREYYAADRMLFDAKPPESAENLGGHGVAFDWTLLKNWTGEGADTMPWMLAGGLRRDNVAQAISISGARAVDVSSGVERIRGLKNADMIADFVEAVRAIAPRTN
ncbi:MAG: phosphoribosylanthranilate isomerase [Hyphomonadaceae bacterium]